MIRSVATWTLQSGIEHAGNSPGRSRPLAVPALGRRSRTHNLGTVSPESQLNIEAAAQNSGSSPLLGLLAENGEI